MQRPHSSHDFCGIFFEQRRFQKLGPVISNAVAETFTHLKKKKVYADLYCLSDKSMAGLNRRFKKRKGAASVISFPARRGEFPHPELPAGTEFLGEIFLAPDYIRNEKQEPLSRFLIHGILHLAGYTHARESDRIEMEAREEKLKKYLVKKGAWK